MLMTLDTFALMFLQEVGFDVVSIWSQTGFLAKGTFLLIALGAVFLVSLIIWRVIKRPGNPEGRPNR